MGQGGGLGWGGVEGWGEKAHNCNWITIKKKKTESKSDLFNSTLQHSQPCSLRFAHTAPLSVISTSQAFSPLFWPFEPVFPPSESLPFRPCGSWLLGSQFKEQLLRVAFPGHATSQAWPSLPPPGIPLSLPPFRLCIACIIFRRVFPCMLICLVFIPVSL